GAIELYYLYFALSGLYQSGQTAVAEQVIRAHYEPLLLRAPYLPETISRYGMDSQCHAWSCHPLWWLQTRGLRGQLVTPGGPDRLRIAPESVELTRASGTFPHPRGDLHIAWRIDGPRLHLSLDVPEGVTIAEVTPRGALASLELKLDCRTRAAARSAA